MFIRIGTQKWHITLEILYWYTLGNQMTLLGITTPLFTFILAAWHPSIYLEWKHPRCGFWYRPLNSRPKFVTMSDLYEVPK